MNEKELNEVRQEIFRIIKQVRLDMFDIVNGSVLDANKRWQHYDMKYSKLETQSLKLIF